MQPSVSSAPDLIGEHFSVHERILTLLLGSLSLFSWTFVVPTLVSAIWQGDHANPLRTLFFIFGVLLFGLGPLAAVAWSTDEVRVSNDTIGVGRFFGLVKRSYQIQDLSGFILRGNNPVGIMRILARPARIALIFRDQTEFRVGGYASNFSRLLVYLQKHGVPHVG